MTMCAPGELHDIGLRIVSEFLRLEHWEVFHLGANVPPRAAVDLCVNRKADVLVVSVTLPPHIAGVAEVVQLARARRELDQMRRSLEHLAASCHGDDRPECPILGELGDDRS